MAEADPKVKDKPKTKRAPALLVPLLACVLGAAAGGGGAAIAVLKFAPGVGLAWSQGSGHAPAAAAAVPAGPLEYVPIENAFTSNLADSGRYLQVKISLSTYGGPDAVAAIGKHQPALVSAVLAALGEVRESDIESARAKDALRERLKAVINATLKSRGEPGGVEEVFFTSLVVQ
ncbi:flagellar basal body-associated FliL family protein [Sandarakinorhabdus oryzae]|uniref:flagellar basal body-associated FliL family protein n=1 Tax=Sandarakinorhabdus oryzae TaxID=2675220 RepID=UPI0012E0FEE4|nr:flagellar basal body-associated FliL family protein [Sandarakinorhabdus oryzae]